jgi:Na+-transporting methylmalonyl-CoA/oxaloacetate decarboxylase gamma subunit
VDTIHALQALLGGLLLVLAGLALIMLAVMLLLAQANAIVWLAGRLTRSLRSDDRNGPERQPPANDQPHARSAPRERTEDAPR